MNTTQVFEKRKIAVAIGIDRPKTIATLLHTMPTTRSASPKPTGPTRTLWNGLQTHSLQLS